MPSPLTSPRVDPTAIFEIFRGSYGSELLGAAIAHFDVFTRLAEKTQTMEELSRSLSLQERPAIVLTTALRAMGLLQLDDEGRLNLTPLAADHLVPGGEFYVGDYVGLAGGSPGVLEMAERLKTNQPAGLRQDESGAAFIYRAGLRSAMEQEELARHFTLALAGRAKNVAPVLAERVDLSHDRTLLDVGGGTGIYSVAMLRKYPELKAIVLDRPEVLRMAREFAQEYGVADRMEFLAGDMFADELPGADVVLLSNILHDWDVPECQTLVNRCVEALTDKGRLIIHDVLLNDDLGGPLPIALYSAALFTLTEGRAYSAREYSAWMQQSGVKPQPPIPTLVHCHALIGSR